MHLCCICRAPQPDEARFCSQCGAPLGHLAGGRTVGARPPRLPPLRYHTTPSGLRLAFASSGDGQEVLLVVPGLVTHLTFDWQVPEIRAFYERLGQGRRLLRYDRVGGGLSDRAAGEYDASAEAEDIFGLLTSLGLGRVEVFAWSQGGLAAVALAARHPECVSRLVLCMASPVGPASLDPPDEPALTRGRALRDLIGVDYALACRTVVAAVLPGLDPGWSHWAAAYMHMTLSPGDLLLRRLVADHADVRSLLPAIHAPTLVLRPWDEAPLPRHADPLAGGAWVEVTPGQYLASHIPAARLVDLPSGWHLPFLGDTEPMHAALGRFLGDGADAVQAELTVREAEILRLIAQGLSNREIAIRLGRSASTVKRHAENIYGKLGVAGRAAAVAAYLGRTAHGGGG